MSSTADTRGVSPSMETDSHEVITFSDIASRHKVTIRTIRRWIQDGDLPAPMLVQVPGSNLRVRRWDRSILGLSDRVAAKRRRA